MPVKVQLLEPSGVTRTAVTFARDRNLEREAVVDERAIRRDALQRSLGEARVEDTFGVTEEDGIEFAPDGRFFVTSIGSRQSTVWVHDSRGDRQITSEGDGFLPTISPDGTKLYYLVRAKGARNIRMSGELWVADLESGQRQRLLPDFLMQHYTMSVMQHYTMSADGHGWLTQVDRLRQRDLPA
jgi:WD40 repeat protein